MNCNNLIVQFLAIQAQVKILHWQTKSYSRHKAFDDLYDSLDDLIDSFVESYQGKYGRIKINKSKIELLDSTSINLSSWLNKIRALLIDDVSNCVDSVRDSDLLGIRDDMLSEVNKLNYLLTFK